MISFAHLHRSFFQFVSSSPIRILLLVAVLALLALSSGTAVADTVTTHIPLGAFPSMMAVNTATNKIYVTDFDSNNLGVIDGATNTFHTLSLSANPNAMAINPITNKVYVANFWLVSVLAVHIQVAAYFSQHSVC